MHKAYPDDTGKTVTKLTPGRKIGEYTDWDGNVTPIPDMSLESGLGTKIVINGGLPHPDLNRK